MLEWEPAVALFRFSFFVIIMYVYIYICCKTKVTIDKENLCEKMLKLTGHIEAEGFSYLTVAHEGT